MRHLNIFTIRSHAAEMNNKKTNSDSVPKGVSLYPKVFNKDYLDSKVKEVQPYGSEVQKADRMYLLGTGYILKDSFSNGVGDFSVESQTDADVPSHHVKIVRKSKLHRDTISQFKFDCSCKHFARPEIKLCKHIIYVLKCYYSKS